jgi:phage terminase small subunit
MPKIKYPEDKIKEAIAIAEKAGAKKASRETGIPAGTIRSWLHRGKSKGGKKKESPPTETADEIKLTEKQRLFCLYYVKNYNATLSAMKAGYSSDSAHAIGSENLRKPAVAAEIRRLKGSLIEDLHFDAQDVLREYAKIAFSNIGEYVEFGQKEVPIFREGKMLKDPETGEPLTMEKSYVSLRESADLDGSIITEVSQGREGIKIKFADKMKALEKMELYFDLLPDRWKRKIEEEKLELEKRKLEAIDPEGDKAKTRESIENFINALGPAAKEAWKDEK